MWTDHHAYTHAGDAVAILRAACRPGWLAALLLALTLSALLPGAAVAQEGSRAGLIVVHGDGRVVQQCVSFNEESISGYELLQRGSLPLNVEAGGFGATVCSIDGEGCSYPAESCFCRCQGTPCVYWSYWRLQPDGGWRYQPLGAGNTQVSNGDVEAWRWAEGTTRSAVEPPAAHFDDICTPPLQAGQTATSTGAVSGAVSGTVSGTVTDTAATAMQTTVAAPRAPAPTAPERAVVAGEAVTPSSAPPLTPSLLLLGTGAVILPAAVLLVWALLRRK